MRPTRQNGIQTLDSAMTIAITATSTTGAAAATGSGGGSGVAQQAQLDRCTKQLGDWVNCSSGKTPEGKQIIEALQEKISSIKQQIQTTDSARSGGGSSLASGAQSSNKSGTPPVSLALASIGSVGTLLNAVA